MSKNNSKKYTLTIDETPRESQDETNNRPSRNSSEDPYQEKPKYRSKLLLCCYEDTTGIVSCFVPGWTFGILWDRFYRGKGFLFGLVFTISFYALCYLEYTEVTRVYTNTRLKMKDAPGLHHHHKKEGDNDDDDDNHVDNKRHTITVPDPTDEKNSEPGHGHGHSHEETADPNGPQDPHGHGDMNTVKHFLHTLFIHSNDKEEDTDHYHILVTNDRDYALGRTFVIAKKQELEWSIIIALISSLITVTILIYILRVKINAEREITPNVKKDLFIASCCVPCYLAQAAREYDLDMEDACEQTPIVMTKDTELDEMNRAAKGRHESGSTFNQFDSEDYTILRRASTIGSRRNSIVSENLCQLQSLNFGSFGHVAAMGRNASVASEPAVNTNNMRDSTSTRRSSIERSNRRSLSVVLSDGSDSAIHMA